MANKNNEALDAWSEISPERMSKFQQHLAERAKLLETMDV